ncbi:MAG: response regulator transcription factor [Oscillospiraceae bacterium]
MFHILVAEDDKNTRKLMCAVLKQHGFEVSSAENGLEALEVMDRQHVDLIVLDIMMPEMDGYELTKELRAANMNLPILMVSAKQEAKDKRAGFRVGTDDYMTKPVDEEEMVLRIRALLRRAQIAQDKRLYAGDTVLDYNALSVTRGGERITLPQKEFQLLFKLLSYPGIIFTRMQLMDEIWGKDSDTDDHTVNVHINRLRDKLKDNKDFEIVTVRGLGYKAEKLP